MLSPEKLGPTTVNVRITENDVFTSSFAVVVHFGWVYFVYSKGDYYRYLAEFKSGDDKKEVSDLSLKAYQVMVACAWILLKNIEVHDIMKDLVHKSISETTQFYNMYENLDCDILVTSYNRGPLKTSSQSHI
ncbi:14-3-3 protein 8 [Capsicum baccatum]|uniref:14-3-3 protein 8 n=1 Tax=Capsicum baccatum TaxID=33114 RepID=A0A2G2XD64_CAPBA|nr:14-3-3 protein 8 [Capsicum baccatum]